jgi:hypothetical protein
MGGAEFEEEALVAAVRGAIVEQAEAAAEWSCHEAPREPRRAGSWGQRPHDRNGVEPMIRRRVRGRRHTGRRARPPQARL